MKILTSTWDTTNYPSLSLSSGTVAVSLITRFVIKCEVCSTCAGSFNIKYNGELSDSLPYTTTDTGLKTAIEVLFIILVLWLLKNRVWILFPLPTPSMDQYL